MQLGYYKPVEYEIYVGAYGGNPVEREIAEARGHGKLLRRYYGYEIRNKSGAVTRFLRRYKPRGDLTKLRISLWQYRHWYDDDDRDKLVKMERRRAIGMTALDWLCGDRFHTPRSIHIYGGGESGDRGWATDWEEVPLDHRIARGL